MALLCIHPGRRGRELADVITDSFIQIGWTHVLNKENEETRRMYVYDPARNRFSPADVPISKIRVMNEDIACALELLKDADLRDKYVDSILSDESLKYG